MLSVLHCTAMLKKHKTALFRKDAKTQPDVWSNRQKMKWLISRAKGQLMSKCLFGVFIFFRKNEVDLRYHGNKVEFIWFFFKEFTA